MRPATRAWLKPFSVKTGVSALLLGAIWGYALWRAGSTAITIDEAFTFNEFVAPPLWQSLTENYDANNHILHSLLCRISVALFGVSELSLRTPAILGAALYLFAVWRVARILWKDNWLMVAAPLWMAAHPTVLDFLTLARGYGLGLACWMIALGLVLEERWRWVGVWLGLAVGFNLIFLVPGMALLAVTVRRWRWSVLVPFVLLPTILLAGPLSVAGRDNFYFGARSWGQSVESVFLVHGHSSLGDVVAWLAGIGIVLALFSATGRRLALVSSVALAILATGHWLLAVPLPHGRTGIYWIPLAFLCLFSGIPTRLQTVSAGLVLLAVPYFLRACPPDSFMPWQLDASNRRMAERLVGRSGEIAVNWPLVHPLQFYGTAYRQNWTVLRLEQAKQPRYWLLGPGDTMPPSAREIARDGVSGVVMAGLKEEPHAK